ncbi:NHS-like protein 3 [Gastrophryne carolinensis]
MSTQTALPPDHDPLPPGPDPAAGEPKKKKHKGGTLRRALSWLRGRKKKKPEVRQPEGKDDSKPDGESQSIPASEPDSSNNVFFPDERTQVMEEIHNQAQEGLKSLQRREKHHNKVASPEEEKTIEISNDVSEEDFRTRSHSCSTKNTDEALTTRSEMIQRKGSTFRPYDSPSGSSKKRRPREKRATVVGVPQHVAAELGLHTRSAHRGIHELFSKEKSQEREKAAVVPVVNGVRQKEEEYVVIPTVDGMPAAASHIGAHISLATLEQQEAALQRHIDKVYLDDSCIGWKTDQKLSPLLIRPKSVAVPGMTTHSPQSDPVSPVMSISPQATYMSKIIPNAVLPPLVDVVALSRSSVRTLSRCSLATASPASIRGSLHRGRGMSTSSDTWSRSQSTETIVSDSSTISSRGGDQTPDVCERHESRLSTGRASPAPSTGTQDGSDAASLCSGRSSIRSVSLRKSKKAPPPPKRTYSLQQQKQMGLPPRPEKKSASKTNAARDPWILRTDKAATDNEVFLSSEQKLSSPTRSDRTLSPSSGYSSQSGTPTLPVRSLPESPGSRRRTPPKPERSSLKSATGITISSLSSAEDHSLLLQCPPRAGSSMGDQEGHKAIPPHPNVPAPTCPPPNHKIDLVATPVATPPPSPPPSHHPTPPPVRKSESDAENPALAIEETIQKDSLWPPPPPEVPDVQDLSMADFPPPDDELFLPPPPTLEPVNVSVISGEKEGTKAEIPPLISNSENSLDLVEPQLNDVPLTKTEPLTKNTHINSVNLEALSQSVPTQESALSLPAVKNPTVPVETSGPNHLDATSIPAVVYKPHFASTSVAETAEPKKSLKATLPQDATDAQSTSKLENKDSSNNSSSPSPVSVDSSSPVVPSAVVATNSVTPSAGGTSRSVSNVWKPVSAPASRKLSQNNQAITVQPTEDASLPIVTPSLLQMVRLRSVQARGPQSPFAPLPSGVTAPQKPVRKSLSYRSPQGSESSQGESPTTSPSSPIPHKPPDSPSAHRSPASAASFVFARGSRKFVLEPPASQGAESSAKKDLVTEPKSHSGPLSPDGKPPIQRKPSKIPPPVARKPSVGMPRTPTSPLSTTGGPNGSVFTPKDVVSSPSPPATSTSKTLENHEKHKSQTEQA